MAERKAEALIIARKLVKKLQKNGFRISESYLFGSFVHAKEKPASDIDLALISDDFCGIRFLDIKRIAVYIHQIDNRLEVHTFSNKDKDNSLFLREIIDTGIKVA